MKFNLEAKKLASTLQYKNRILELFTSLKKIGGHTIPFCVATETCNFGFLVTCAL